MIKRRMKGFTLIELIAVLVILAILALIVTPLVMSIIKKAKDASNRRSVDAYGKSVELAVATYLLDYGQYPSSLDNLTIEYSGNEVTCNTKILNDNGSIYLSGCSVNNTEVLDSKNSDGYYHYGKTDSVSLNDNYEIGDKVIYNGIEFYVIEDSNEELDYVKLITVNPLKSQDMNDLISSVETQSSINANDEYVMMPYYSSDDCVSAGTTTGCFNDYDSSSVKQLIDVWQNHFLTANDLKERSRLITTDELIDNLGYSLGTYGVCNNSAILPSREYTPSWVYNFTYWTMTGDEVDKSKIKFVTPDNVISTSVTSGNGVTIRPVITLYKSSNHYHIKSTKTYKAGDEVVRNDIEFYVMEDSSADSDTVKLLKKTPLTYNETAQYGSELTQRIDDYINGGIKYYVSDTCDSSNQTSCKSDYSSSEIKKVVDAWANDKMDKGLEEARLISIDDLMELGYEWKSSCDTCGFKWENESVPSWFVNSNSHYWYWTMSPYSDSQSSVWTVNSRNEILNKDVYFGEQGANYGGRYFDYGRIRPVVILNKSTIGKR